ncbi:amidohydrolase family protein [Amycolatopsis acidiphila]|uniref:Amidohydrolase n=1 Tax=Amycolatopsis acidiphila TaxID=715473 RepID=A0A558A3D1_9PSEU|nr:amidohydrolase family protein [Amycolatopsis acidiphila]TVT18774.1 amidohydrolase [Amycolatopsis acidiphila]UIJ56966.1 amidohydrolase family protein [Amycolatopsis acidiphila]GHG54068.1 hydrolase [Amycolatopsis acidiphila]
MTEHIDTDVHCAPASLEALFPYFDGYWRSYITDANLKLSPSAANAYPPGAPTSATPQARAAGAFPPDHVDLLRKQVLDRDGLRWALLNCTTSFDISRNPYYEAALTRAVNDWVRTEWLDQDDRLRASMVVPTLDVDAAVAEIERLGADRRFVQVLLPVRGQDARYGNKRFHPLLAAAARHGLVVGLHAWGRISSSATPTGFAHTYLEDYVSNAQIVQAHVVSLIAEGVFRDLPDLRICLAECGFSWLPALFWRFDKEWRAVWREVPWMKEAPAEYLYRHFRATTEPAQLPESGEQVAQLLEMMRVPEFLMHASDYPHDHGDGADRLLAALSDSDRVSVLHANAAAFYRQL